MLSFKNKRKKRDDSRRRAAADEFLRVVQEAGSTPELIQRVAGRRFYMKCCAALAGPESSKNPDMRRLYRELEQAARRRGFLFEEIRKRLEPVAKVLGLGPARHPQPGLQADYYGALGISPKAGDEEIKKAYRRQARQVHPDAPGGDKNRFLGVHEAYEVLADPGRRRQYDESRAHAMHLGWTEDEEPGNGGPEKDDPLAGQVRKAIYLLAAVVAVLVMVAIVADMVIRG